MIKLDVPFNLGILNLNEQTLKLVTPVTSLDIFDGSTKNFHPAGLYSTEIFGSKGSEQRFNRYSYIDIKVTVFQPVVYRALIQLRSFYADIISGREFAVFDEELHDFVKSNAVEGETGFDFFVTHWTKLIFEQRKSSVREQNIKLIENFKDKALTHFVYVIPAAYRDIEIADNGRETSDEINSLYWKLIAISNTIIKASAEMTPQSYNQQRSSLQNTYNEIYDSLLKIIEGKKNLIMGKWASRRVMNGTRNVIIAMDTSVSEVGSSSAPSINHVCVGLYQYAKANLPVARFRLKTGFLSEVFSDVGAPAWLTNTQTLQSERVELKSEHYDQWMTNEGLEGLISSYKEPSIRERPVMVGQHYLGLCYRGPDNTFKLIHGIGELPQGRSKEHCTPITYTELLYVSLYGDAGKYPGIVTRYPIVTDRSTFPAITYLMSTIRAEKRMELDADWRPYSDAEHTASQFPVIGSDTYNALAPHPSRLSKLGGD